MVFFISWSQYFTFINIINTHCFKDTCFYNMTNTCFCHNWN